MGVCTRETAVVTPIIDISREVRLLLWHNPVNPIIYIYIYILRCRTCMVTSATSCNPTGLQRSLFAMHPQSGSERVSFVLLLCACGTLLCLLFIKEQGWIFTKPITGATGLFRFQTHSVQQQQVSDASQVVSSLSSKPREWFLSQPHSWCARHEIPNKGRVSQAPFVSGETFRTMADHIYDETSVPHGAAWDPADVTKGDVVFVKTDFLPEFFSTRHQQINTSYILISHNR